MVFKYPVKRTEYSKVVGKTRVDNIARTLENLGFKTTTKEPEVDNVDMWVHKDGHLVLVIEVLNWRRKSYMDIHRAEAIKENLSYFKDQRKLVICSFRENFINQLRHFRDSGVDFLVLGFQTQPDSYYSYFSERGRAKEMRKNDEAVSKIIEIKMAAYLFRKRLL